MKLFAKYNRVNLLATTVIFLLASVAFSVLISYVLVSQLDDNLDIERHEIKSYVEKYNRLPENIPVKDQYISYTPTNEAPKKKKFATIRVMDAESGNYEMQRALVFPLVVNGQSYSVTVAKSMEGTDDMIRSVIAITLITICAILIVSFLTNRILLRKLWQPFYGTVDRLKDYRIGRQEKIEFPETDIDEFALLNSTLEAATGKANEDYLLLKAFTENASHELQTPIAVVRSKLDVLIQDEQLTKTQSELVEEAYEHIRKITRLNQSLLLLAKIENRQFMELASVPLQPLITAKLKQFKEMLRHKGLEVIVDLKEATFRMDPYLADVLLNNLLSNAIRHNVPNGKIKISLTPQTFTIGNSGIDRALDNDQLFVRFSKTANAAEHNGLGLSIIKEICAVNNCDIAYSHAEGMHTFTLSWRQV